MNFCLLSDREMTQKNRNIHNRDSYNQMLNHYQSLGSHLRWSQVMQGRQNYPYPNNSIKDTNLILQSHPYTSNPNHTTQGTTNLMLSHQNFPIHSIQGLYHENTMGGAKTQPMVHLASSSNNNGSLMSAARHGGASLSLFPRDHPFNMGSRDVPPSLRGSIGNSSLKKNVGLQSYTNDFSNAPKTTSGNHINLPYSIFETNSSLYPNHNNDMNPSSVFKDVNTHLSHNMKNSSMFKDCNPMSSHDLNNSSLFKDSTHPYPRVGMNSFQSVNGVNMSSPSLLPTQTQTSFNRPDSLARERAMKRPLCEIEGIHIIGSASKMPRMSSTPHDGFYEENEPDEMKELLLFKDLNVPFSASENMTDASEEDEEYMDLSLHL